MLDYNKVVTHLDQGLWKETELKRMSASGRKQMLIPLNFPSNAYQLQAMINVLERKGILTGKEVMDELEVIVATKGNGWRSIRKLNKEAK